MKTTSTKNCRTSFGGNIEELVFEDKGRLWNY